MEAYDTAVLSYALASATFKTKPGILGISHNVPAPPTRQPDDSLTPPRDAAEGDLDGRNYLYQLLYNLEQMIINKTTVQMSHLMEICSTKQPQVHWDQQISAPLNALLGELRQICKINPGAINQLKLTFEDETNQGVSLNTEIVCKTLSDLLRQFGLTMGANIMKRLFSN